MKRINIDDQVSEFNGNNNSKIRDVIKEVITALPPNRIVTKVCLDGLRFAENEKAMLLDQTTEEINSLEIRTADKSIWAATGLDISLSCIERVQRSLIRSAELFRENDKGKANRLFLQCIEGLEKFIEAITITRSALNLNFDRIAFDGYTLTQAENALNQVLKTVVECQEKQDYQGLADKIEYELLTNLVAWTAALTQLRNSNSSNA